MERTSLDGVAAVELFLLGGSYRPVEDHVEIELYGRTREGESVVALYTGFRPYFELAEPTQETRDRLARESNVLEAVDVERWVKGSMRPALRVYVRFPFLVPDFRERYRRPGDDASVLACDIPFVHRFLYDKAVGLTIRFEAEEVSTHVAAQYSAQRVVRVRPDPSDAAQDITTAEAFRPPLTVLGFDIENAIRERTIFTICGVVVRNDEEVERFRIAESTERGTIEAFVRLVRRVDPDVLTGYNIGGYDFPLLLERAKVHDLGPLALGRDGSPPGDMGERLWRVHGRIVADAWWSARRELRPKQETLEYVARTLLNDRKLEVDRRNIDAEWAANPERVQEYCEHDARLAVRILLRLRSLEKAADLATVARLPLEEGLNGRTSLFVDSILIPRADRRSIGVPPTHRLRRENPIEGGYVHTIRPGLSRWVVVLDFKAMYPSIIISKNICFTTLSPQGAVQSPSGARFLSPEERRGLIPEILEELLARRDRFRRLGSEASNPDLRRYYDGLQNAVKILMNSFYGVLASSFYRFTNKDIGAAITAFGREAITSIIRALEADGHEVVYSDTDSIFVRAPEPSLDGAKRFGESVAQRFTDAGVTFEFQSVFESFFSHGAKKRYVGRTVWPREELVVRGYETRRTDAFDYQQEALSEVFDLVLRGETARAIARARELITACREGRVSAEKLVIARTVRAEEQYAEATREALAFLRVYRRLKEEGYDVIPGMKVAWIVTDAKETPQRVEPWIEGRALAEAPDYEYYADRVAQTLARVTEVFDWDASALLRGRHQRRLDAAEVGAGEPGARTVEVASGAPLSLDSSVADVGQAPTKRRRTTKALTEFS
jgi:DNA polymerase I